jgi:hypothetical protein
LPEDVGLPKGYGFAAIVRVVATWNNGGHLTDPYREETGK